MSREGEIRDELERELAERMTTISEKGKKKKKHTLTITHTHTHSTNP